MGGEQASAGTTFLAIWDGNGKSDIAFPQNGMGTEKPKQLSRSLGLEWKNPNVILIVRDGNSKS